MHHCGSGLKLLVFTSSSSVQYSPSVIAVIEILSNQLQIYSSQLNIHADFTGIRYDSPHEGLKMTKEENVFSMSKYSKILIYHNSILIYHNFFSIPHIQSPVKMFYLFAHLPFNRYLLFNFPLLSAFLGVATNFIFLSVIFILSYLRQLFTVSLAPKQVSLMEPLLQIIL